MERQREEEEKRRKQEETTISLPKDSKQTIEEMKTLTFFPNAFKSLEDINFTKLSQAVRADSPG